MTDFEHYVEFKKSDTLNNFNVDIKKFVEQYEVWIDSVMGDKDKPDKNKSEKDKSHISESELYIKAINPLKWIKELLDNNKVFNDPDDPVGVKTRF